MPNTFDAVPTSRHERSRAFMTVDQPADRLETIMEEAQLHRGSLREQDGYTIPFREGGQVRIRVQDGDPTGLEFSVDAPNVERRDYIEGVISETARTQLDAETGLDWER